MVVDDMKQRARLTTGHGPKAIRLMEPVNIARARKDIAVPEKHLAPAAAFLEDPPAKGVIAIAPAGHPPQQAVLRVPFKNPSLRAETLARDRPPHDAPVAAMFRSGA